MVSMEPGYYIMSMYDQPAQMQLREKLDYELWLLDFLSNMEDIFTGGKDISTITLTNRQSAAHVAVSFTEVLGSGQADPFLPRRLDVRSFTLREVTLLLMVMRQLSISLFALLKRQGIHLQEEWKEFKSEWIKWDRVTKLYPIVIAARQHPPKEDS